MVTEELFCDFVRLESKACAFGAEATLLSCRLSALEGVVGGLPLPLCESSVVSVSRESTPSTEDCALTPVRPLLIYPVPFSGTLILGNSSGLSAVNLNSPFSFWPNCEAEEVLRERVPLELVLSLTPFPCEGVKDIGEFERECIIVDRAVTITGHTYGR
jgi:hypothetical protein